MPYLKFSSWIKLRNKKNIAKRVFIFIIFSRILLRAPQLTVHAVQTVGISLPLNTPESPDINWPRFFIDDFIFNGEFNDFEDGKKLEM